MLILYLVNKESSYFLLRAVAIKTDLCIVSREFYSCGNPDETPHLQVAMQQKPHTE